MALLERYSEVGVTYLTRLIGIVTPVFAGANNKTFRRAVFCPFVRLSGFNENTTLHPLVSYPGCSYGRFASIPCLRTVTACSRRHRRTIVFYMGGDLSRDTILAIGVLSFSNCGPIRFVSVSKCSGGTRGKFSTMAIGPRGGRLPRTSNGAIATRLGPFD